MILNDFTEPKLKFSQDKLDAVLAELCELVVLGQKENPDFNGLVAAAVIDPKGRLVTGLAYLYGNRRVHAERAAIDRYEEEYGKVAGGTIIVTTLSPCSDRMDSRYEESCTNLLNSKGIKLAYCGYNDPSQKNMQDKFVTIITKNNKLKALCKKFAHTFLDRGITESDVIWEDEYDPEVDEWQTEDIRQHLLTMPHLFENDDRYIDLKNFLDKQNTLVPVAGKSYAVVAIKSVPLAHYISIAKTPNNKLLLDINSTNYIFDFGNRKRTIKKSTFNGGDSLSYTLLFNKMNALEQFVTMLKLKYSEWRTPVKDLLETHKVKQHLEKQGMAESESNDTAISLSKLGKFHPGADTLAEFVPERATAQYALHPDKWESTFYSLTNKDSDKLKYYGPKKISIPSGTLVGDMAIANKFYRAKTPEEQEQYAELYKQSLRPYPVDVSKYRMPELLIPKQGVAEGKSNDTAISLSKLGKFHPGADTLAEFLLESFDTCYNEACRLYDQAEAKGLDARLLQVAGFQGDGSSADPRWQKIPKDMWQHYVVLVGDLVLDPTAKQFGPEFATKYNQDQLEQNWQKIYQIRPKEVNENFSDGKGPGRPGDSQRHGIPKGASMAELEKASHSKGRKGQLARWQLNMRRGKKKVAENIVDLHKSSYNIANIEKHFGPIVYKFGDRIHGPVHSLQESNSKLFRHCMSVVANHRSWNLFDDILWAKEAADLNRLALNEDISPVDKDLDKIFTRFNSFNSFYPANIRPGDQVFVVSLAALEQHSAGKSIYIDYSKAAMQVSDINSNQISFTNGFEYPDTLIKQLRLWRQIILFDNKEKMNQCLMALALYGRRTGEWEIHAPTPLNENYKKSVMEITKIAAQDYGDKGTIIPQAPPRGTKPLPGGSGFTYHVDRQGADRMEITLYDQDQIIGELDLVSAGTPRPMWQVEAVVAEPEYQGRGIGMSLYGIALSLLKLTLKAGATQTVHGQRQWLKLSQIAGVEVMGITSTPANEYKPGAGDQVLWRNQRYVTHTFPVGAGSRSMKSARPGTGIYNTANSSMIAKWTGK